MPFLHACNMHWLIANQNTHTWTKNRCNIWPAIVHHYSNPRNSSHGISFPTHFFGDSFSFMRRKSMECECTCWTVSSTVCVLSFNCHCTTRTCSTLKMSYSPTIFFRFLIFFSSSLFSLDCPFVLSSHRRGSFLLAVCTSVQWRF